MTINAMTKDKNLEFSIMLPPLFSRLIDEYKLNQKSNNLEEVFKLKKIEKFCCRIFS